MKACWTVNGLRKKTEANSGQKGARKHLCQSILIIKRTFRNQSGGKKVHTCNLKCKFPTNARKPCRYTKSNEAVKSKH